MGKLLFRADTCDLKKLVGQHGAHISAGSGLALYISFRLKLFERRNNRRP